MDKENPTREDDIVVAEETDTKQRDASPKMTAPSEMDDSERAAVEVAMEAEEIERLAKNLGHELPAKAEAREDPLAEIAPLPVESGVRSGNSRLAALPGAHAVQTVRPDGFWEPAARLTDSAGYDEEQPLAVSESNAENSGLAEAKPIEARQVQPRTIQPNTDMKWRKPAFILCYMFSCTILVVVLVAITRNNTGNSSNTEEGTSQAPTSSASLEPSIMPSLAPPGVMDLLELTLPDTTQQSLQVYGTPQWLAWDWLLKHPNVTSFPNWKKVQLFSLATFYYSFEGPNWNPFIQDRWMDYTIDECFWFSAGFGLFNVHGNYVEFPPDFQAPPCNKDGEFTNLMLTTLGLSGRTPSIPEEITLLTSLEKLHLFYNNIEGQILDIFPIQYLQDLPRLAEMMMFFNELTGPIPSELGLLSNNLNLLDFSSSKLTGTLPSSITLLSNLKFLNFMSNSISGAIPSQLGILTKLTTLNLQMTAMSGRIPSELGLLTELQGFSLSGLPLLTGTIPTELGGLTNLGALDFSGTSLSGTIPSELGRLAAIIALQDAPLLEGSIPSEFTSLVGLNILGSHGLTGTLPKGLCHLQNATSCNHLIGIDCILEFDCSDTLCGCNCTCADF
jgi:hypothetical protein